MSFVFNIFLIYWLTDSYTKGPTINCGNEISNDPNSPCNPSYIKRILQTNPNIQRELQKDGITIGSVKYPRGGDKDRYLSRRDKEKVARNIAKNKNEINNDNDNDNDNDDDRNNKQLSRKDLKVITLKGPSYDKMSSFGDENKRELSWISPMSRRLSGDINRRANPNLFITESEQEIWFNNHFFIFEKEKMAFCVMEKNSCSMFKQIFKRIRGKKDYLSTDYTKIHYLPYRGLEDISFNSIDKLNNIMNNNDMYFAAFIREPLERLVSGYIDKCDKKRGVNLCDYARWSPRFEGMYGKWSSVKSSFTPKFGIWADGLFNCPCWPETDWHFAPQFNFCNLYQYVDKYDIFRFENRTHRKIWMERAGIFDKYGKQGWKSGGNDGVSIVDFGPQKHSSTGASNEGEKYIKMYKDVDPDILATIIDHYRNDYIIFGIQMPQWMCSKEITINNNLKRALRTLPRTSRPPCDNHKWLWERE